MLESKHGKNLNKKFMKNMQKIFINLFTFHLFILMSVLYIFCLFCEVFHFLPFIDIFDDISATFE